MTAQQKVKKVYPDALAHYWSVSHGLDPCIKKGAHDTHRTAFGFEWNRFNIPGPAIPAPPQDADVVAGMRPLSASSRQRRTERATRQSAYGNQGTGTGGTPMRIAKLMLLGLWLAFPFCVLLCHFATIPPMLWKDAVKLSGFVCLASSPMFLLMGLFMDWGTRKDEEQSHE